MDLLSRILAGVKTKAKDNKNHLESQVKEKLKSLVYDDELVEELLPAFVAMSGSEHFSTVMELLESKEAQIEAMAGGDWFKQESKDTEETIETNKDQESTNVNEVDNYLKKKYGE